MDAIIAEDLSLTYSSPMGHRVGVGTKPEGLSFSVKGGEIFGVIGPDGAGKTTLFRILASLLRPHRGRAKVAGCDTVKEYKKLRKKIGYMPGVFSLYGDLTVEENMLFFASIYGTTIRDNYHLVGDIYSQIEPFKDRKAQSLSGGMKQKLALSCALIHSPEVLFLDEPTTGIDPISRVELWDMLSKLSNEGVTVVASTPYMDEALRCNRIAFMVDGEFVGLDEPAKFVSQHKGKLFRVKGNDRLKLLKSLRTFPKTLSAFSFGEELHLTTNDDTTSSEIQAILSSNGFREENTTIGEMTPTLEDAFLQLTLNNESSRRSDDKY